MNDFTNFSDLEPNEGEAALLDEDFDNPTEGSVEQAAMKIDEILGAGVYEREEDTVNDFDPSDKGDTGPTEDAAPDDPLVAVDDDPLVAVEIDGKETTVSLSELTEAWTKAGEVESRTVEITQRRSEIDTAFETANAEINSLIPSLQRQLLGDFADLRSPQDLQALAMTNPARFADLQARSAALQQAEGYANTLTEFRRGRVLETESAELAKLIPELTDPEGGDQLRDEIRAYGKVQGFGDERFADAGATEIAILHKAMKYDQLEQGQVKAARRARDQQRARPVMTPGHARREDPKAGYRQAMTKLKKTGHVEDAARVIELML